jgi:hypothetical protein
MGIIGRWTRGDGTRHTQRLHEVTDRQALADGLSRVLGTARVEDRHGPRHQDGSEGNILGHYQVSGFSVLGDVTVGDIGAAIYPNGSNQRVAGGRIQSLIGYQNRFDAKPLGRAEHKLLYVTRRRICIYPDLQCLSFRCEP